jgi:hypothetical protein
MNKGRLGNQGLTEIFFESAEPGFDEFSAEEFLNLRTTALSALQILKS